MEAVPAVGALGEALPVVREVVLDGGVFADQLLRDAALRERFGVTVIGIRRVDGEYISYPTADTVLHRGDRLRLFGLAEQIARLSKALAGSVDQ